MNLMAKNKFFWANFINESAYT